MKHKLLLLFFLIVLSPLRLPAETYYIDYDNGADTNNGTTKETPWKHAPGMYVCTDNCAGKETAGGDPGDEFILKGGVTWPRAALSWDWIYGSGTEANPIYFGVDATWYSGESWSRPILDAEDGLPNASAYTTNMFRPYGDGFVIDNLEFKGFAQLDDVDTAPTMLSVGTSVLSVQGIEVKNCYFHGWSHGGTATKDYVKVLQSVQWSTPDLKLKIHDNVWDGSDTTKDMAMAYKGSAGHFYNNYLGYMTNGVVTTNCRYIWGNTFYHIPDGAGFDATTHINNVQNVSGQSIIWNNLFISPGGGTTIGTRSLDNTTDYIFNNVVVDDENQTHQIYNRDFAGDGGTRTYTFNNTFQSTVATSLISGPTITDEYSYYLVNGDAINNHLIGSDPTISWNDGTTNAVTTPLIGMTEAQAASAGYVSGSYFMPHAEDDETVNTGYDMSAICAELSDASPSLVATDCLKSTTLGVIYDSVAHTVSYPAKEAITRSDWDIGAYEWYNSASQSGISDSGISHGNGG